MKAKQKILFPPMKASDFFDRMTILKMKTEFDTESVSEYQYLASYLPSILKQLSTKEMTLFFDWFMMLAQANAKTWILEASLRKEFKDDPSSKETLSKEQKGERADEIRTMNKKRIEAKQGIDRIFCDFLDKKFDHGSV